MNRDPRFYRPSNYDELIKRYRKVDPVVFPTEIGDSSARENPLPTSKKGLHAFSGEFGFKEKLHLLRRTQFGVTKEDLLAVQGYDLEALVNKLLENKAVPDPPVNDYIGWDNLPADPDVPVGETWVQAPFGNEYEGPRIVSLKSWLIKQILESSDTIYPKLVMFWHTVLVTQSWDVFISRASYQYFEMLHQHALGNYRDFIKALTVDPAMLIYLNGAFNNKEAPDENYARELQELFTLGKGPDSGFTEADVAAAARVLTGWVIEWDGFEEEGRLNSRFEPYFHDTTDKQFSSYFGNKVIRGRHGDAGADETDELLDMIFLQQETSRYVVRRLYNFFVHPVINPETEELVIRPLAQQFYEGGYEIRPVLKTLLMSDHFYDPLNQGAMIKSPADTFLGTMRTLQFRDPGPYDLSTSLQFRANRIWEMASIGQEIGDPPSVAGWQAYYQAPQFDKSWITTDTILKRAQYTDSMIFWGLWINDQYEGMSADLLSWVASLDQPDQPEALLREMVLLLTGMEPAPASIDELLEVMLSGHASHYWTTAWQDFQQQPNGPRRDVLENRLKAVTRRILQLGEFQLM
jgi:hypothetical protein